MKFVVLLLLVQLACVSLVLATGGDFIAVDLVASASLCYNHRVGGGAYNDDTNGRTDDTVESLQGPDFSCGDIVSYLIAVEMKPVVSTPSQGVQIRMVFDADTTGQSGVGFGNVAGVTLNRPGRRVENGNGWNATATAERVQVPGGCRGVYAKDGFPYSNDNERISVESRVLQKPLFNQASTLEATVVISGLEAGERVVGRFDIYIYCLPRSRPTGNLQGNVLWKQATDDYSDISGGQQTIPFHNLDAIGGLDTGCVPLASPLVAGDFRATVQTIISTGGVIESNFSYSWDQGKYLLTSDTAGTYELHTFENLCTFLHTGEFLYSQSTCGCEATKIGNDQPQLFFNSSGYYYDPAFVTMIEPYSGINTKVYSAAGTTQSVVKLWIDNVSGVIVRIDWADGRIMLFSNVVQGLVPASVFDVPGGRAVCACRRRNDIVLMFEKSLGVDEDSLAAAKSFGLLLVADFEVGTAHSQFAVMTYGDTVTPVLGINAGNTAANVNNAINSISCAGRSGCGTGADGDVALALDAAVAELLTSTRSFVGKSVIFVTNGWTTSGGLVDAARARAAAAGINVFVVSYNTLLMQSDLAMLATHPDNVIQRYILENLATLPTLDMSGRICAVNVDPCGASCCGHCDAACGTCKPVDSCPTIQGCATASRLVGNCCVNVTTDTCPPRPGMCEVGVCNAANNSCGYTPTCLPVPNDACNTYNCVAGSCVTTPTFNNTAGSCFNRTCVGGQVITTNVSCPASDACTVYSCVEGQGCVSTPTTTAIVPTACETLVCDPRSGWRADPIQGCDLGCTLTCPADDRCVAYFCTGNGANQRCDTRNTTCTAPGLCFTSTCNATTGCVNQAKVCDDNNPCTVDSCNATTGNCSFVPRSCGPATGCEINTCNTTTGACERGFVNCSDGFECTTDRCNATTGQCVHEPHDELCDIQDPCQTFTCSATAGCQYANYSCPSADLFCQDEFCIAGQGCSNQTVPCNITEDPNGESCNTVACVEEEGMCVTTELACALPPATIAVIATITGGVIAGIVVAIVAFIACAGGASFAAYRRVAHADQSPISNNPLYRGNTNQGENPLFQPGV